MSKRSVSVALISGSVAALLSVGVAAQGSPPSPLPSPSQNVNVTNVPLPVTGNVTGTVSVSGTVPVTGTVNITNVPTVQSQQSGAWNVGITGPVSLASGSTVNARPQVPLLPFAFYNDQRILQVFGPAAPSTRLAITSLIMSNGHPSDVVDMEVYVSGCGSGTNKVVYLLPAISPKSTLALSFTSPLVLGSSETWCLVVTPATFPAPLVPVTIVGYLLP
jgi:hypothetical protein